MKLIAIFALIVCLNLQSSESQNKYFQNCDQILDNGRFKSCYNYTYRGVTASIINLKTGETSKNNIKERQTFYEDKSIPYEYRARSSDWINSGLDRGHVQSDASNDSDESTLRLTYAMSNIVMQYPNTNRKSYLEVEKRERELSNLYNITALTLVNYSDNSTKGIRIPSEFIKIFFIQNSKECYKIPNDNIRYELEQLKIDCSLL